MIYSAGSVVENEDGTVSEDIDDGTPILLFCRNLGVVRFPVCFFSFRVHLSIVSLTFFFLWACVYNVVIAGLCVLRQAVLHGARARTAANPVCLAARRCRLIDERLRAVPRFGKGVRRHGQVVFNVVRLALKGCSGEIYTQITQIHCIFTINVVSLVTPLEYYTDHLLSLMDKTLMFPNHPS